MERTSFRRLGLVVIISAAALALLVTRMQHAAPTEEAPQDAAPTDQPTAISRECTLSAAVPDGLPEGWSAYVNSEHCIGYAYPEGLQRSSSSVPGRLNEGLGRLDPDDPERYVSIMIAEVRNGCRQAHALLGGGCVSLDGAQGTYAPVDDALLEAYASPEAFGRCEAIGVDCAVREFHLRSPSGRHLVVEAFIAENRYREGSAEDLMTIVRHIDAQ